MRLQLKLLKRTCDTWQNTGCKGCILVNRLAFDMPLCYLANWMEAPSSLEVTLIKLPEWGRKWGFSIHSPISFATSDGLVHFQKSPFGSAFRFEGVSSMVGRIPTIVMLSNASKFLRKSFVCLRCHWVLELSPIIQKHSFPLESPRLINSLSSWEQTVPTAGRSREEH